MRFRCPHCGEATFLMSEKAGVWTRNIKYVLPRLAEDECKNCKRKAYKTMNAKIRFLAWINHRVYLLLLFFILAFTILDIVFFGVFPFLIMWYAIMYFLMHYDFLSYSEREQRDNILIEFTDGVPFRKNTNEYVCELKFDKSRNIEKTYVIYDDKYKGDDKTLKFCMVVGRTPEAKDEIKIVLNNGRAFAGTVSEVIQGVKNKAPQNIPQRTKKANNDDETKNQKRWQDPDYFN